MKEIGPKKKIIVALIDMIDPLESKVKVDNFQDMNTAERVIGLCHIKREIRAEKEKAMN